MKPSSQSTFENDDNSTYLEVSDLKTTIELD